MEKLDMNLSLGQRFEMERFNRVIDECNELEDLRKISKQLLQAWFIQKAATTWVMKDALSSFPKVTVEFSEDHGIS
jgi:hypothetical protein